MARVWEVCPGTHVSIDQTDSGEFIPAGPDGYPARLGVIADRYEISRMIGKGGMACVYLAYDQRMRREVALKILQRGLNDSEDRRTRFAHEIEIMASVRVEGVVDVYDCGEFGGWQWYAMPYIPGEDLEQYLERQSPGLQHRLAMVTRLAKALAGLHEAGISHRDLKPANIMIGRNGMPLLMDFGIAKYVDSERRVDLTDDGVTPGTPLYMAPERFLPGSRNADLQKADVFGAGLIFYEILTGEYAIGSKQVGLTEHVLRLIDMDIESVQALDPQIPLAVSQAVDSALRKDPNERATAQELAHVFEEALHEQSSSKLPRAMAVPRVPKTPAAQTTVREQPILGKSSTLVKVAEKTGLRPRLLVAALATLVLLVFGIAYNIHQRIQRAKVPQLTVHALLDGQEISRAEIKIDGRSLGQRSPNHYTMEPGESRTVEANYRSGNRLWTSPRQVYTADWEGERHVELELTEFHGPVERANHRIPDLDMDFRWIPPLGYWVGVCEVTNAQFRAFTPEHNSGEFRGLTLNEEQQPAVSLTIEMATAYASWLTERERAAGRLLDGWVYRLPTEAEWLAFARCGHADWIYPWPGPGVVGNYWGDESSDEISPESVGDNGFDDGHKRTCDVYLSGMNEWGLYGVGGNATEICLANPGASDQTPALKGGAFTHWSWTGLRLDYRQPIPGGTYDVHSGLRLILARPL